MKHSLVAIFIVHLFSTNIRKFIKIYFKFLCVHIMMHVAENVNTSLVLMIGIFHLSKACAGFLRTLILKFWGP